MRKKGFFKVLLVLVLALSMLLTSCSFLRLDGKETESESSNGTCKHAETELKDAKAATCISEGYSGDRVCKACGEVVETGTAIAMLSEHRWDEGVITKNATCVSTGVKTFTCTVCLLTNTETVELTECKNEYHFIADEAHALTCGVCFKATNGEHTKSKLVLTSEATCLEGAYEIYHCDDCDSDFKVYDSSKPAFGHDWDIENPVLTPATCSSKGEQYYVCKNENCTAQSEKIVLDVAPGVHTYELSERVDATCTETGIDTYSCAYCGDSYSVRMGKLAHTYGEQTTEGAWTYSECSVCGHSVSSYDASNSNNASINADGINDGQAFEIKLQDASVEFPADLVESLGQYYNNVTANADVIGDTAKDGIISSVGSDENKAVLEGDKTEIYDFGVNLDDEEWGVFICPVTVTVPYTLWEGEDPNGIVVWYVAQNGDIEEVTDVAFADADGDGEGTVQFSVNHFSCYAVAYKETPAMRCRRGVHDYSNDGLWSKRDASCDFYGYTVKVCKSCGHSTVDNYVEPRAHSFGDKITPDAACDKVLYAYQQCEHCNYVKNLEYISPIGHKVKNQATCDMGAVCETCHKILIPAYGHNWSEWSIVAEATEDTNGLKRRHCPICGEIEEIKLPKKSDIEAWDIDSFSDLFDLIFREGLALDNGKLSFKMIQGEVEQCCDITVNIDGESEIAEIKLTNISGEGEIFLYYKDGAWVAGNGENTMVGNVDQLPSVAANFEEMFNFLKSAFAYYESYISEGLEISGALLDEYIEVFGESIDAQLKADGKEYTATELKDAFNSLQALYVYLANKLGTNTVCEIPEGVEVPGAEDLHNVLSMFMEKTEAEGNVTYTYDVAKVKTVLDDIIKQCNDLCDKTLAEAVYVAYGDVIKAHLPELTDWSKLMEYIRKEFGGSVKVGTVIDKLLDFVESSEAMTKDELFDMLDKALAIVSGTAFDTEALVKEYGEKTVDQMLKEIYGEEMTATKLYDELNKYMTETKLGDVTVDSRYEENYDPETGHYEGTRIEISYRDKLAEIKTAVENIMLKGNISITLDAEGNIVAFDLGGSMTDAEGNAMSPEFSLIFDRSEAKIKIPDNVKKHFDVNVTFNYDDKGNLIISGVPSDAESFEASLQGTLTANIAERVELDKELTAKYGFNVYVLKEEYWDREAWIGEYVVGPDGKLYAYSHRYENRYTVKSAVAYSDIVANASAYLPKDGEAHTGVYELDGEEIYVYDTIIGQCYRQNGVWMVATYAEGGYTENGIEHFSHIEGVEFTSVFTDPKISSIGDYSYYYTVNYNGENLEVRELYLEGPDGNNLGVESVFIDGEIYLVDLEENNYGYDNIDILGEAVDVPEYDELTEHDWSDYTFYLDGNVVEGYKLASIYKIMPTYYAEYDGYYFNMSDDYYGSSSLIRYSVPFTKANVSGLETRTLPDGRPLYVVATEGSVESHGTVYGYILVNGDWYVQTACEYQAGTLSNIYYRAGADSYGCAAKYKYSSASDFVDVNEYITKANDGKITVSSDLIQILKKNAIRTGDYAVLSVSFGTENERYAFGSAITVNLPEVFDPEELYSGSRDFSWNEYFGTQGSSGSSYSFAIDVNEDGSITVSASSGSEIKFEFGFDMDRVDATDIVKYSAILSEQYGFDVYTAAIQNSYHPTYAFYNGKYYYTESVRVSNGYTAMSPEQILKNYWSIERLSHQFDEVGENGVLGDRIYCAEIRFNNGGLSWHSTDIFVKIVDGEIYVLTGISEATDITLKYEGQVALSEFINALTLVEQDSYAVDDFYGVDSAPMGRTVYDVMYGDEYITDYQVYYINDGIKTYVYNGDGYEWKDIPNLDSPVTLPAGWKEIERVDDSFKGTDYQMVSGSYITIDTSNYAFVGDTCVDIDYYHYSDFEVYSNIADSTYIIGVDTGNGWVYYSDYTYGENGLEFTGLIEVPKGAPVYTSYYMGSTDDGYDMYSCVMFDENTIQIHEMSNGVKVYARAGSTDECYAKIDDDFNMRGYLVQREDGSYSFRSYWYDDSFTESDLAGALEIYDLIEIDGTQATISPKILETLEKYSEHVRITVRCYEDGWYNHLAEVEYAEFASWFAK